MEAGIEIRSGEYRVVVAPARGGSILAFDWRGRQVLRETRSASILDVACFPLVPFSNRILQGRFDWRGRTIALSPNLPAVDPCNPLHGFGWLSEWTDIGTAPDRLRLEHRYPGGEWPWAYRAELVYALDGNGLTAQLAVTNLSAEAMPTGLGFHPYFPRGGTTRYLGLHRGEWQNDAGGLPVRLDERDRAIDWWNGEAVGMRPVDTVYTGRAGALRIFWPDRDLAIAIKGSGNLCCTSVYVPSETDWFCIEPVTHMTDALNRAPRQGDMAILQPHETLAAGMRIEASAAG